MKLTHTNWKDMLASLPIGTVTGAIFLLLGASPVAAQHLEWIRQLGTSSIDSANAVAADGSGGVFVHGDTRGSLGGPNAGVLEDLWLARYDADGTQLWIRQFGTDMRDLAFAASPDGSGGVFLSGYTEGSLGAASAGLRDAWLGHFDGAGNPLWIRQFGTSSQDEARTLAPDGAGGVYVGGMTAGSLGGPSAGLEDAWFARYDGLGNQLWIRQLGTTGNDDVNAAAKDGAGGVYCVGWTTGILAGTVDWGQSAWVARYDAAGNQAWIREFGTGEAVFGTTAAPDGSGGVYVGGDAIGSFGDPWVGLTDVFLARYDGAGNQLWIRQYGTTGEDYAHESAADGLGGVYTAGVYGTGSLNEEAWLDLHDAAGNLDGTRSFSTSSDDVAWGVALRDGGGVFVSGSTRGNLGGPNAGESDAWLARWEPAGCGQASISMRNAGPNPASFQANAPVLGGTFTATVDLTTTGHGLAMMLAYDGAVDYIVSGGQHLLCADLYGSGLLYQAVQPGPLATFVLPVPNDAVLCGVHVSMQAMHVGTVRPFALSNAQDLVFGN